MSKIVLSKYEYVWGTIQNKNGFKFIIIYNSIKKIYTLYSEINSKHTKITSSNEINVVLKKIREYEIKNNMVNIKGERI